MSSVDVSIVVATRNRPTLLARALDSIARQTLHNFEGLVEDDGSDHEHEGAYGALFERLGRRFSYERVMAPSPFGSGPAASRNRGLARAQGRYVAFLDDDDVWTCDDR